MDTDRDALTRQLVDELTYSYRGVFEADDIRKAVDDAWGSFATHSRIPTFLPVLVARHAREH